MRDRGYRVAADESSPFLWPVSHRLCDLRQSSGRGSLSEAVPQWLWITADQTKRQKAFVEAAVCRHPKASSALHAVLYARLCIAPRTRQTLADNSDAEADVFSANSHSLAFATSRQIGPTDTARAFLSIYSLKPVKFASGATQPAFSNPKVSSRRAQSCGNSKRARGERAPSRWSCYSRFRLLHLCTAKAMTP